MLCCDAGYLDAWQEDAVPQGALHRSCLLASRRACMTVIVASGASGASKLQEILIKSVHIKCEKYYLISLAAGVC